MLAGLGCQAGLHFMRCTSYCLSHSDVLDVAEAHNAPNNQKLLSSWAIYQSQFLGLLTSPLQEVVDFGLPSHITTSSATLDVPPLKAVVNC